MLKKFVGIVAILFVILVFGFMSWSMDYWTLFTK